MSTLESMVTSAALAAITHEVIVQTIPSLATDVNAETIAHNAVQSQIEGK
jgi:hypothetical protein